MACGLAAIGFIALCLAGAAQAMELDRLREFDEAQKQQRALYERTFAELKRLEPERLRAENGQVVRTGNVLELSLADRRKTFLRNDDSRCLEGLIPSREDGCVDFIFVGHPVERFYLLRAHYLAGADFRLVDRTTGLTTKIIAEPHFSPDGARFVAASAAEAFDPVGIEMWSTGAGEPSLVWKHQPSAYALYYVVGWEGNARVALEVLTYVDHELKRLPAHLLLSDGGWRLDGPIESSRY